MSYVINDTIGKNIQYLIYNMKCIQERIAFTKSLDNLKSNDKDKLNKAINKVKQSVLDVAMLCGKNEVVTAVLSDVGDMERMSLYMALTEQLYDITLEDLEQVVDLLEKQSQLNNGSK